MNVKTVGQHLKRRRLQLGLFQKDVARIIKVSEDSVTYWENGRSEPQIRYFPQIIRFLGYSPFKFDSTLFGEIIKKYRIENGLSHKKLGYLIGVDGSTINDWGKKITHKKHLKDHEKSIIALIKLIL